MLHDHPTDLTHSTATAVPVGSVTLYEILTDRILAGESVIDMLPGTTGRALTAALNDRPEHTASGFGP